MEDPHVPFARGHHDGGHLFDVNHVQDGCLVAGQLTDVLALQCGGVVHPKLPGGGPHPHGVPDGTHGENLLPTQVSSESLTWEKVLLKMGDNAANGLQGCVVEGWCGERGGRMV